MYKVLLAGGIASGKSSVARLLGERGARLIDLDDVSREVTRAGSPMLQRFADVFGEDVIDARTGELRRHLLAERAFASQEGTKRLEAIEIPAIKEQLGRELEAAERKGIAVCVVEVPLLDRAEDLIPLMDEVLCVTCPLGIRRARAQGRGMDPADFDRRVAQQADDTYLASHATTVIDNSGSADDLKREVWRWWRERTAMGWETPHA